MQRPLLALLCLLLAPAALAADGDPAKSEKGAYVTVNIGVELHAIERAATEVATSMSDLSRSVATLSKSPSLSEEQKAELLAVMGRVDSLSGRVVEAINGIPGAVEKSREPLVGIASDLAYDVMLTIGLTLALLVLVVLAILVGIYFFVLKPARTLVTHSTQRITDLFAALERTADLVAQTNAAQLDLAQRLGTPGPHDADHRESPSGAPNRGET